MVHSIKSLLEFVKELNKKTFKPLIEELEEEPSPVSVYYKLSKQDWKDLYGPHTVYIYNELHPHEVKPVYWRVSGAITNSFAVKGIQSRMYQNADTFLGYYESEHPAFFFEENGSIFRINVLFKKEDDALHFDSYVHREGSSLNNLTITIDVSSTTTAQLGARIYSYECIPKESLQDIQSVASFHFSIIDRASDEFKYQRIEKLSIFGSIGNAESCRLMSSSQSDRDNDKNLNNRLALSGDLHDFLRSLNTAIPLFYLKVVSISDKVIVNDRYKVVLAVVVLDHESAGMIFWRLKEGSSATNDPLVMNTPVYVTDPNSFQKCLEWEEKEIKKKWEDYYSMDSAVP